MSSAGYYCPAGTSTPNTCPQGYYCPTGTASYQSYPCPAGYYCPVGSVNYQDKPCPSWYYCPLGGSNSPTLCPSGYFCAKLTSTLSTLNSCPAGSYCQAGSTTFVPNSCPPGFYCQASASYPSICPSGYYCPAGTNSSSQYPCPSGYFCLTMSSTYLNTPCPSNFYCISGSSQPTLCPAGYFCPPLTGPLNSTFSCGSRLLLCSWYIDISSWKLPSWLLLWFRSKCTNNNVSCRLLLSRWGSISYTSQPCPQGYVCPTRTSINTSFSCPPSYYCNQGSSAPACRLSERQLLSWWSQFSNFLFF